MVPLLPSNACLAQRAVHPILGRHCVFARRFASALRFLSACLVPGLNTCLHTLYVPPAELVCRGTYAWESSSGGPAGATSAVPPSASREQLITQLRTHSCEITRASEELALLNAEQGRCLSHLLQRQVAIEAALERTQHRSAALQSGADVPLCSSFGSRQPGTPAERWQEQMYCDGLAMLLTERLQTATAQLLEAQHAFAGGPTSGGSSDPYEGDDEDDRAM